MSAGSLQHFPEFEQRGGVRLRNVFDTARMAEAIWHALGEHGTRRDDPATWHRHGREIVSENWLTRFGKSGAFAAVANDALDTALTELLGNDWTEQSGG